MNTQVQRRSARPASTPEATAAIQSLANEKQTGSKRPGPTSRSVLNAIATTTRAESDVTHKHGATGAELQELIEGCTWLRLEDGRAMNTQVSSREATLATNSSLTRLKYHTNRTSWRWAGAQNRRILGAESMESRKYSSEGQRAGAERTPQWQRRRKVKTSRAW